MDIEPAGVEPGSTIGGYRVDRVLGRGGMGAVVLAYDTTLRRSVALKVLAGSAGAAATNGRSPAIRRACHRW